MIERVLPLPPGGAVARPRAVPAGRTGASERVAARVGAPPRRPVHVAVAVGASAALYAVSLAGVTALQAANDARVAGERAPASAAIDALRRSHDATEAELARLDAAYAGAAEAYRQVADALGGHEKALDALGQQVAAVEGSAATLRVPSVHLPTVAPRTVAVARPATNACTTASGKPC